MRIHVRTADDWMALYVDGRKVYENHDIPLTFGLRELGIEFTSDDVHEDMDYDTGSLKDGGDPFPETL